MKSGDVVELRAPAEILATLDENACLDGQPFMPEMLRYFGKSFRVDTRVQRACDTVSGTGGSRKFENTVFLDDLRCSGAAHGGCQAQCRIYWNEAWLRPLEGDRPASALIRDASFEELERLATQSVVGASSTPEVPTFRCQATELLRASQPLGWWSPGSLIAELTSKNVGPLRFIRVTTRIVLEQIGLKLRLISTNPFKKPGVPDKPLAEPQGLQPGDLVQVRSRSEIAATIDLKGKNRGLWFDREMLTFCGKTARVKTKVETFVDEPTGRLVHLGSDCYILDGMVCTGERSPGRWFCCREIYPWWRESWLRKLEDGQPASDDALESDPRSERPADELGASVTVRRLQLVRHLVARRRFSG